ncbi:hypothetical protein CLOSYM_02310 [[Clostridium] symbiosum ATCC 14940]|uniref:Uncharacterized protein n=1 Tax=[Clostridium] symbiosum ATCC 14940 TaxID=411472 RepID=A0ABC9TXR0_CLOSY|nr:hypothetical protein CLOSYM_02310 [[Clostridium] symbiosum ATCC 14940]
MFFSISLSQCHYTSFFGIFQPFIIAIFLFHPFCQLYSAVFVQFYNKKVQICLFIILLISFCFIIFDTDFRLPYNKHNFTV